MGSIVLIPGDDANVRTFTIYPWPGFLRSSHAQLSWKCSGISLPEIVMAVYFCHQQSPRVGGVLPWSNFNSTMNVSTNAQSPHRWCYGNNNWCLPTTSFPFHYFSSPMFSIAPHCIWKTPNWIWESWKIEKWPGSCKISHMNGLKWTCRLSKSHNNVMK